MKLHIRRRVELVILDLSQFVYRSGHFVLMDESICELTGQDITRVVQKTGTTLIIIQYPIQCHVLAEMNGLIIVFFKHKTQCF